MISYSWLSFLARLFRGSSFSNEKEVNFRNDITLVLSAGHGAVNAGKYVSKLGYKSYKYADKGYHLNGWVIEGVLNRFFSEELERRAKLRGYKVKNVHHPYEDTPLDDRIKAATSVSGEACLIPIHFNASESHKGRGTEFFTTRGETHSDKLAELFWGKMFKIQRVFPEFRVRTDVVTDGDHDKEANFKEILAFENYHKGKTTTGSCIYLEVLFFDNIEDLTLSSNQIFMSMYLDALLDAIDEHYKK